MTQSFGLDCDNNNHACDTCVNANCYWCHSGSNDEPSFCTSNPNLCLRGSLYEDSLFCPVVKSSFESLDWWGENAFFSRATTCSSFTSTKCEQCIWFADDCGWCKESQTCEKNSIAASCPQAVGCALNATSSVPAVEDVPIMWNINVLFATQYETNDTTKQLSTSANYTVAAVTLNSNCNVTFDSGSDNITVAPFANWFGICQVRVTAASRALTFGYNTTLSSYVDFNFTSVNDPPMKNESSYDSAVSPLNSFNQTATVTLEACRMFYDEDKENFIVTASVVSNNGAAPQFINSTCLCYSGNFTCPIKIQAAGTWDGKITFTARDPQNAQVSVVQDVTISAVNRAPVWAVGTGNVSIPARETDENEQRISFANEFTDPDGNSLTYTLVDGFGSLTVSANFDNADLVFKVNQTLLRDGSAVSRVVASDGSLTATKWVNLTVTAVNDAVNATALKDRIFSGVSATNTTFDLTPVVTDEESSFAAGTLKCVAGSVSGGNGGEAIVTITKNILLIQHRQETSGVDCQLTCDDSTGSSESFNIKIVNTLVNQAPVIKQTFPEFRSSPPASGSINLSPNLNFSDYFSDPNIYQTINYNIVSSNSTAVSFSTTGSFGFTVIMFAGASGSYTLNVTATDEKLSSVSQLVHVLAYVKVGCQSLVSLPWNPSSPLTVDLASYCSGSNTFNVTFTENIIPLTLYDYVTPSVNGTRVTFTANDSCASGVYSGMALATDTLGGSNSTSITLTTNNTLSTIQAKKTNFTYLVTSSSVNGTSYDGAISIQSQAVTLELNSLVSLCASQGPLEFWNGTVTPANPFLEGDNNGTPGGPKAELFVEIWSDMASSPKWYLKVTGSNTAALTQRVWMLNVPVTGRDIASTNTASFTVTITKNA